MRPLKLAILTGMDSPWICQTIASLARLAEVQVVGVLVDTEPAPFSVRLRNLRRNVRRQGLSYAWYRIGTALVHRLETLAARVVSESDASALLRGAFPGRSFRLADVEERDGIPLFHVGNLNGPVARDALSRLAPDLGVVLGTRILKRPTFAIPRMGCVNLHLGKVPEYRGLPPGFWELYEGQASAGATVHFVDDELDTGDMVGEDKVPIGPHDDPDSLRKKLELGGSDLLVRCVADLASHCATRRPQQPHDGRPHTMPTRRQRRELQARSGIASPQRPAWINVVKTLLHLSLYYGGLFHAARALRRIAGASRACVLLYHRVNDLTEDPLTTNVRRFAEHMITLRKHYTVMSSSEMVRMIQAGERLPPHAVAIHFDDGYQDVYTEAAPILATLGFPACCFVSSGYVGTDRVFPHDRACPWVLPNTGTADLAALVRGGLEIGSHTVNHADLGACTSETAAWELVQSKRDLEAMFGRPITLFSYPFGKRTKRRQEVAEIGRQSGYQAMFSCYGGYVSSRSDPFDLPRVAVSAKTRPLDLLMEIEGLSLGVLKQRWNRVRARTCWPSSTAIASPARPDNC